MQPEPDPQPQAARILLVEDEVLARDLLAEELRDAGFVVVEAERADAALVYLLTAGAVDLLFTDIELPGSLNGLDLARRVRSTFPALPVILTSGSLWPPGSEALGVFVPKPFRMSRAVALIRTMLGLAAPGESA